MNGRMSLQSGMQLPHVQCGRLQLSGMFLHHSLAHVNLLTTLVLCLLPTTEHKHLKVMCKLSALCQYLRSMKSASTWLYVNTCAL